MVAGIFRTNSAIGASTDRSSAPKAREARRVHQAPLARWEHPARKVPPVWMVPPVRPVPLARLEQRDRKARLARMGRPDRRVPPARME
jgi:hypothetical protein